MEPDWKDATHKFVDAGLQAQLVKVRAANEALLDVMMERLFVYRMNPAQSCRTRPTRPSSNTMSKRTSKFRSARERSICSSISAKSYHWISDEISPKLDHEL